MDPIIGGALIGGGASLLGTGISAGTSFAMQEDAQDFAKTMAKKRIRWMAKDLEKAGFNRVLAATQATGGSGGSAPMASMPDFGSSMARGASAGAQVGLRKQQGELLKNQTSESQFRQALSALEVQSKGFDVEIKAELQKFLMSDEGKELLKSGKIGELMGSQPGAWLSRLFGGDFHSLFRDLQEALRGGYSKEGQDFAPGSRGQSGFDQKSWRKAGERGAR